MDSSVSNLPHVSIASVWWPSRGEGLASARRAIVLAAFGVALLAVSAKINLPLPYVPMTLQTLVVLMIGAVYGWRLGTLTIIAYLAVGALGLPVFAGPVGGLKPLTGATAGFLSGFVVAAFVTGWFSERGWDRSMVRLFVVMAIGHIVIMAMGFAWLAYGMKLGAEKAWLVGVMPFLAGALVKNTLGAILVPVLRGMVDRRYR
ncbi:biotin transporter BioY [Tardiphaga sp. OK246]|jgi:biotin transport system substrate-specific component|uniref:biotin transporter BioY n=1 Tax=Tardiphaga sp. OK246 TaxID=1855307 RepID=UPI000B787A24|nr:biotin transporter BioY [Tardiphaga sp. OK246]